MTEKEAFTARVLSAIATARADKDHKTVRVALDALAKEYGIPKAQGFR
jgi:hypothetical protein